MSRSRRTQRPSARPYRRNADRRIRISDDRRDPPDQLRLARALLQHARELAAAQAEADAQRQLEAIDGESECTSTDGIEEDS